MVEPLHQERDPRESALDPNHGQLREALAEPVRNPIGHVKDAVERESERVHGGEAIEILEYGLARIDGRVERERQAALLQRPVDLHMRVVMHR